MRFSASEIVLPNNQSEPAKITGEHKRCVCNYSLYVAPFLKRKGFFLMPEKQKPHKKTALLQAAFYLCLYLKLNVVARSFCYGNLISTAAAVAG